MNYLIIFLLGYGLAVYSQQILSWNKRRKARKAKNIDELERELGIVGEDGSDPEIQALRLKRVQKKQLEILKQNG